MSPAMSSEMKKYFDKITSDVKRIYEIANEARKKGYDPSLEVECPPAHDMAGRVENLVGPEGVAKRIRELKDQGLDEDHITFKIADEIIEDKFGKMTKEEKVDRAIRVALAIKTEGVVSAPLEGISAIKIRENKLGGPPYLSLYFAGPIRAAGGTVQAFAVLISDYVRGKMGIAPYVATEEEVGRFIEEVKLYDRIVNLQYPSTKEELDFAVRHLKVELNGDPTESREVSAYRNLKRIETNLVRSGPCLVLNDGVLLKSKKILKVIKKMKIPGWEWLEEIKKYSHSEDKKSSGGGEKSGDRGENGGDNDEEERERGGEYGGGLYDGKGNKGGEDDGKVKLFENAAGANGTNSRHLKETPVEKRRKKLEEKVPPVYKYIADVIGGRPVFAYPSRVGGHRIRYGRSRNTGLAACGLNPNTMYILNEFLAVGTQIKIERPGKAASVMPVTSIEGPVCLLENGDVVQFNKINSFKLSQNKGMKVKRILFLGDILFGFGEFAENNHTVLPSGYVEEWWRLELEEAFKKRGYKTEEADNKRKIEVLQKIIKKLNLKYTRAEDIINWIENPFDFIPTGDQTLELAKTLRIPLHPHYTHHYGNTNGFDLLDFREDIIKFYKQNGWSFDETKGDFHLRIPKTETCINFLQSIFCPYKNKTDWIEISSDLSKVFIEIFALKKKFKGAKMEELEELGLEKVALEMFPYITDIIIRDKAPYYMGTRMGRPEKAHERKMKPPVHVLFPLGHNNDYNRNMQNAIKGNGVETEIVIRQCPKCNKTTYKNFCDKCKVHTELRKICPNCGYTYVPSEVFCPNCNRALETSQKTTINFEDDFNNFVKKLYTSQVPTVKGVKGLSSEFKMPEPLEKGILRAKHNIWVFKDGTVRFDALDIPFTHFTPREIGTSVEKLKELGYTKDYLGRPLTNEDQICELKCQDFIATEHCGDYFVKVANFIDDELELFYGLDRFYNCSTRSDLIGHYFAGLAPHTSAAIVGRLIGFSPINAGYGHPYWHAAKRRNCDGDEDGLILLMDVLLNFSRFYLPAKIGGKMDAPLVLSVTLDPNEVDGEAHNVDTLPRYELDFYQETLKYPSPADLEKKMHLVKSRLKTPAQYEGIRFTHPTQNINYGPKLSIYKQFETMDEKINSQLDLSIKIDAVDEKDVARKILHTHFIRDIMGNLRKFSQQGFRCPKCNAKYRRVPIMGKCTKCGNPLLQTVTKGGIIKYLSKSLEISKTFDLGHYTTQRMELIAEYVKSLTDNPKVKQVRLTSFFS
ncbi:MAG: DNA polymerase II large subunit [Promethearchaeota archaeon]